MRRKSILIIYLTFTSIIFGSCNFNQRVTPWDINIASPDNQYASAAYLTRNHNGIPILAWTAHTGNKNKRKQYFALFNEDSGRFGDPIAVSRSIGTTAHAESMNKVAWKDDGTIISVFEKKHPHHSNQWAGSVMYTQSFDEGKTWASPKPVHSDTTSRYSRSFFDVTTLPNGEVAVVWIDGRHGSKHVTGSSIYLSRTQKNEGFLPDRKIMKGTCECCRTVLHTSNNGIVYLLFRNIFTGSIRDMALLRSEDSGETFPNKAVHVHNDNWAINACPHTGPTLGTSSNTSSIAWVTGGNEKGLLYTTLDPSGKGQPPILISETGVNPQLDVSNQGITGLVWVERNSPTGRLHFQIRNDFVLNRHIEFNHEQVPDVVFPVILSHNSSWIIAWTEEKDGDSMVKYASIKP